MACIFCKIVAGQIPCHKLYEDDRVLAFLDVNPVSAGHCLVIPKAHHATIDGLPDDLAAACGAVIPRLSRAVTAATGATAWNVLQNNGRDAHQAVDHVHFHVIPKTHDAGLGIVWPARSLDDGDAAILTARVKTALSG